MIKTICYLLAIVSAVSSQNTFIEPQSPCPNVFKYVSPRRGETPGPGSEKWYGELTLNTDITLHALWLNIILDRKADILGNWVGEVTTEDNINFKVENTKMKLVPNTPVTVRFFIQYKERSSKPNLHTILFNGREICNASNIDINKDSLGKPYLDTTTLRSTTVVSTKNSYEHTKVAYPQVTTSVPKWTEKVPIQQTTTQNPSRFGTTNNVNKASLTPNVWGSIPSKIENNQKEVPPVSQQTKYETQVINKNNSQSKPQRTSGNQQTGSKITKNDVIQQLPQPGSGSGRPQIVTESNVQTVYSSTSNSQLPSWLGVVIDSKDKQINKDKTESQLWSQKVNSNNQNTQSEEDRRRIQVFQDTTETSHNKFQAWSPTNLGDNQPTNFKQQDYIETTTENNPVIITGNSNYYIESSGQIIQSAPSNKDGNNQRYEIVQSVPMSTSEGKYPWAQILSESASRPDNSRYGEEDTGSSNQNKPSANPYQMNTNTQTETDHSANSDHRVQQESEYFTGGIPTLDIVFQRPENTCGKVTKPLPKYLPPGSTTSEGQWPWQAAIYQQQTVDFKYICGATLVSRRHVITAAHCVAKKNSRREVHKNTLTIYLGKFNLRTSIEGVQIRFVNKITIHPDYNPMTFGRDIAILQLRETVSYTDWVRPACLWPSNLINLQHVIGEQGSVVGWGSEVPGLSKEELSLLKMPVVSQETCVNSYIEFYERFTSEYTYCAGYNDANSVCKGDSGGGMVFNRGNTWYLRGLVSISVARSNEYRCDPAHYVVFTDIAKFLPWIQENIK